MGIVYDMTDYDDTFTIIEKQVKYVTPYKITNAVIDEVYLNCDTNSLTISIKSSDAGILRLNIPQKMVSTIFLVYVDGSEWDNFSIIHNAVTANFPENTSNIELVGAFSLGAEISPQVCYAIHNPPYSYILPPLKQFKSGIPYHEIQCKEDYALMIKPDGISSACVFSNSVSKFFERNFVIPHTLASEKIK